MLNISAAARAQAAAAAASAPGRGNYEPDSEVTRHTGAAACYTGTARNKAGSARLAPRTTVMTVTQMPVPVA